MPHGMYWVESFSLITKLSNIYNTCVTINSLFKNALNIYMSALKSFLRICVEFPINKLSF